MQAEIPDTNKTEAALYVTPREAYAMWSADPNGVHVLDVRTFEEYLFVGHFEMAKNIPLLFPKFDPDGPSMPGRPPGCSGDLNPEFISEAEKAFDKDDTILVMCTTGGRAAVAINALTHAGFTATYNIINGFEGDRIDDPYSEYHGQHLRNGWKNAGLPWCYEFHPDLMWVTN